MPLPKPTAGLYVTVSLIVVGLGLMPDRIDTFAFIGPFLIGVGAGILGPQILTKGGAQ